MPKERRSRDLYKRARASPFPCSSSHDGARQSSSKFPLEASDSIQEWEEVRCPVCMEHPHNAVLLLCTSLNKGCRPYMCDTSYRHSNCLDQFRKAFAEPLAAPTMPETSILSDISGTASQGSHSLLYNESGEHTSQYVSIESQEKPKLCCPLCRGQINGWIVEEPARKFLNAKVRSCAQESCGFGGTYAELRKHARLEHPLARPSKADPERQREWRRMEHQRNIADVISTFQSVLGDERDALGTFQLVLDDERDGLSTFPTVVGEERDESLSGSSRLTFYILIRVPLSSSGVGPTRSLRSRRLLWGQSFDGEVSPSEREPVDGLPGVQHILDGDHMTPEDEQL